MTAKYGVVDFCGRGWYSRIGTNSSVKRRKKEKIMNNLKPLKKLVENLEKEDEGKEQIKILQQINGLLLTDYVIKINDDIVIKPLLVEAYYCHYGKFEDKNSYQEPGQSDHFGKLFIHPPKYSLGVDICLSANGDYFLSFLIKNSVIEGSDEFLSQENLYKYLENNTDINALKGKGDVLVAKHSEYEVVHTVRKGVKEPFKDELLASLPIDSDLMRKYKFTPGKSRTEIIRGYVKSKLSAGDIEEKEEQRLKALARGFVAWKNFKGN